jgi:hypothetical protein
MNTGDDAMEQNEEILFWETQLKAGQLINAIRSQSKRAIKFFRAVSVLREEEMALRYILDARRFLTIPEEELVKKTNSVPLFTIATSTGLDSEQRDWLMSNSLCTVKDIRARKETLRKYLMAVTGASE